MQYTLNFRSEEFECPCCGKAHMEERFLELLQQLRTILNKPMKINSGYRCENHNLNVGGRRTSQHLIGNAIDCSTVGWTSSEFYFLIKEAQRLGFKGIGIAKSYVHLDARESRPKMWVY